MKKAAPWIFLIILAGGFAAWYAWQRPAPENHPSVKTVPEASPATPRQQPAFPVVTEPEPTATEPDPLPPLAQSDAALAEALSGIIGAERLGSVFVLEQLVSRLVSTVDSLDSRQIAPLVMPVRPASGEFTVQGEDRLIVSDENSLRYEPYIDIAEAADVDRIVRLYRRFYPLFQQAYEELGYQDRYFNDRLVVVIDHLLATPATPDEIELVESESVYVFADQRLESLSAGQKIMLRIGEGKRTLVEQKLRKLRESLAGPQ